MNSNLNQSPSLLIQENKSMEAMMSFEDMIKEGMEDGNSANPPDVVAPTSNNNNNNNNNSNINNAPLGQIPEPTEPSIYESLKKAQKRVLNEALYHSAENGFVDISIDLRNMGKDGSNCHM